VARGARLRRGGGPRRRRAVREHGPAGVPRRGDPLRAAPASGRLHRTPLVPRRNDLRRVRRNGGHPGWRLRPRLPDRNVRPGVSLHHDQALPGRRTPAQRRGPALQLRPRTGLPRRQLRLPPAAVQGRDRRRQPPDDALLRHARRHRVRGSGLRLQQGHPHRPAPGRAGLRRPGVYRLGHSHRGGHLRPRLPRAGLGRGRPHPGRARSRPSTPAWTSSAARAAWN
jgi:hypothetical protein